MQYFLIIFEIRAYKPGWEKKKKRKIKSGIIQNPMKIPTP